MPDSSQDPIAFVQTITTLLAALGLSSTAGIRAYLPLVALGIASDTGLVQLQDSFKDLGSPAVLLILAILVVGEFIVDKIPVIDHISDLVHTVIRPISGAVIMAGTANPISQNHPWIAALIGAVLAFAFHGAKAATRPAVSATTAGIGNPIVSIIEDVAAVLVSLLLLFAPIIGFILILLIAVTFMRFVSRIFRKLTSSRRVPSPSAPAYAVAGSSGGGAGGVGGPPRVGGLLGRLGGGRSVPSAAGNGGILSANAASVTPYTPSAPAAPAAPSVPAFVSPNTTTVAATNQAPYAPNYSNPIQPEPPTSTPYPAPTQTYPPVYPPPWPAQPPLATPYVDDTPTSPGKYNANA
ncbi:MAG: DUF4126 domain-containing protein [Ktedonobacterales bacterium]